MTTTKPSPNQITLGELPWWTLHEDEAGRLHIVPWDEGAKAIARDHVVGDCWCAPDPDFAVGWGVVLYHHEPTWPNSAESVN